MNEKKSRIDKLLVSRGIVESRERARALIMAGDVLVDDTPVFKAGVAVNVEARLRLRRPPHPYVSRGGVKLRGALVAFELDVTDQVVADIGASTGGFTDCLLRRGARHVYAVDVDTGQLDWRLRRDSRVTTLEKNARYLEAGDLPRLVDLVTIDVSFISVRKILPVLPAILDEDSEAVVLVKPQFEVGRGQVGKGGIVSDPLLHRQAVDSVVDAAVTCGFSSSETCPSPITGRQGNQEFFVRLRRSS